MNKLFVFIIFFFLLNCTNETIYSGKILNQEDLYDLNFKNKNNLIAKMGYPSFIDPIDNKFFYYSEKKSKKSAFKKYVNYSYVFVFEFDENDKISNSKVYDLKKKKNIKFVEDETENEIVRRGLLESIFGGVGTQQEIPNSQ